MSYCVNCGVELDGSLKECPLCNTPVINPKELEAAKAPSPFPGQKGQVEVVKRKDLAILLTTVVVATAVVCGLLNLLVFRQTSWSLAIIGLCVLIWVLMIPAVIYTRLTVYASLFFDGVAICVYLAMLQYMAGGGRWLLGLGVPITILVVVLAEILALCIKKLPRSFLTVALYLFTATGLLCLGLEALIDRFVKGEIRLGWSAIVVTVCVIVDATIITLLSRKRLRGAVRRRLHF